MGKKTNTELGLEIKELKEKHELEISDLKKKHNGLEEAFDKLSEKYDRVVSEYLKNETVNKCRDSGERFTDKRNIRTHGKKHRSIESIKCEKCEKTLIKNGR